jgi:hypothetical protein
MPVFASRDALHAVGLCTRWGSLLSLMATEQLAALGLSKYTVPAGLIEQGHSGRNL